MTESGIATRVSSKNDLIDYNVFKILSETSSKRSN